MIWLASAPVNSSTGILILDGTLCACRVARMSVHRVPDSVRAIDQRRGRPVYRAKIVNSDTTGIVVKKTGGFAVGKRISFAMLKDLEGVEISGPVANHEWRSGVIWRIQKNCLQLTRT
jgi:hypothetical protein